MARDAVLVINAGSSSIKFGIYRDAGRAAPALDLAGRVEGIGGTPTFVADDARGDRLVEERLHPGTDQADCFARLLGWLESRLGKADLVACGHRVVHGGTDFVGPVSVDRGVLERLRALTPLAPLHQPINLAAIEGMMQVRPGLPQVACFDTAFHRSHPDLADRYALPGSLYDRGIRRYGFHGLSYEYMARRLPVAVPEIAGGRVVVAHLGAGCSMCAMRAGRSVDSTMGFTALDGLPMGTRSGALDPGVVLYLLDSLGMSVGEVTRLLYNESGLKGLSGISGDMRELEASADPRARFAIDYFVHRIARELGALAASLSGIDALVFTAGIGERSVLVRERVCRLAGWLGVELDLAANLEAGPRLSTPESSVSAWVVPTDEELMIATHAFGVVRGGSA
jgi:acetate kinase